MIHKNTPSVCGLLNKVKEMIDIKPVVFRTDLEHSLTKKQILLDNGEFFVSMDTLVELKNEVTTQPTSCQCNSKVPLTGNQACMRRVVEY